MRYNGAVQSASFSVLTQTPGILSGLLAAATREQMDWKPAPDRWSITMVLAHLADVEVEGFRNRFRAMIEQEAPLLPDYDQLALFRSGVAFDAPQQLAAFVARREETLVLLKGLPEQALERSGRHEELGTITVGHLLNEFALHDLGHIRQVAELYRARAFYPNIGPFQRYYTMHP